ncbi:MAG TPA: hypothetical protein VI911_07140 [Patescibacteria group bacterium]|nr:hypothetical protein [Patescibacteria group bacterium]
MLVKDQSPNIYSWSSKTLKAINEPKHLHLSADWDSSNYKAVLSPKITRFSERKLIIDDFDYSYMERNSITEKTSITPFGVAMLTSEETTKGIILGKKASINVISKSKESLTEILDYEQAFRQNLALFKHKHPEAIKTRFLDILKEKAERTARYLIDSGVTLKIEKTENEILIIKIIQEGDHPLNQRAKELKIDFTISTNPFNLGSTDGIEISLNPEIILDLNPKDIALGHELRHINTIKNIDRNFGFSKSSDSLPYSIKGYYSKFMGHDEVEQSSYSLRMMAKNLLEKIKKDNNFNWEKYQKEMSSLTSDGMSTIAKTNKAIADEVMKQFKSGIKPKYYYHGLEKKDYVIFISNFGSKESKHYIGVPNNWKNMSSQVQDAYLNKKLSEYQRNAHNLQVQSDVALQALSVLQKTKDKKESITVLEAIIGTTRPHFYSEGRSEWISIPILIEKFNKIINLHFIK